MENLQLTKLVRNTIRANRKREPQLYTNNYKNCRTIKTYSADTDGTLRAAVDQALHAAGSSNHSIKVIPSQHRWSSGPAFIVRLPK